MKLDIYSRDRIGITQEMLTVIFNQGWNLSAMEMSTHHTFVYIDNVNVGIKQIRPLFMEINGVKDVTQVDLLPNEQKRKHLDALLAKLPDPILDVTSKGDILVANAAAAQAFGMTRDFLVGKNLSLLIDYTIDELFKSKDQHIEVTSRDKKYLLDITVVNNERTVTGAVLIFQSISKLGKQLSAMSQKKIDSYETFIANCEKMKYVQAQTRKFANIDLPVLINGETGTGKELTARALHDLGSRAQLPFMAINCAALPENLLESELFGYDSGAFSGAKKSGKPGLFELANGGTVFLDEIGEMSIYLQAKLLRFLQDFSFIRIGGTVEIKVNVRIICATHRDLEDMIANQTFREDLFYRLNVLSLKLPPLRKRQADIPALIELFTHRAAEQINAPVPKFSIEAINALKSAPWPGNIRQLQNVIFRTIANLETSSVNIEDLNLDQQIKSDESTLFDFSLVTNYDTAIENYEKQLLSSMYQEYPSTRKLANRLAVSHAKISRKLNKYDLNNK